MIDLIIYVSIFVGVVAGLVVWIVRARSAMKSAGRTKFNEHDFPPPSSHR